jgi:hypothetical protein
MLSFVNRRLRIIEHVHNQLMGGPNVIMTSDFIKHLQFKIHEFFHPKILDLIF